MTAQIGGFRVPVTIGHISWPPSHYHKMATTAVSITMFFLLHSKQEEKMQGIPFMHVSLFIR